MIILKINRFIERHGKLAMLIIAAAVVIPFVFMWGPHSVFEGGPGRRGVRNLGTMYGEPLNIEELSRQMRFAQLEMVEREGELTAPDRGETGQKLLQQALQRMRFMREAEKRGLQTVTDAQIDELVAMMFRGEDGRFNRQYYLFFQQYILPQIGLSEMDYREYVKQRIIISRLWQEVMNSIFISPHEIEHQIRRDHTRFKAAYRIFDHAAFLDQVDSALVSDAEVRRYFDANRGSELPSGEVITELDDDTKAAIRQHLMLDVGRDFYKRNIAFLKPYVEETGTVDQAISRYEQSYTEASAPDNKFPLSPQEARTAVNRYIRRVYEPVRKKFKLAVFDQKDYLDQIEVTPEELLQAYERQAEHYEKQVAARHILIRVEEDTDEEREQATARLEELRNKVMEGADFGDLARQYSEDPGSSHRGGELGTFRRDQMVEPFAAAAFAMEKGEVSDIVETQFGFHLIKVDEIIPAREFSAVKDELEQSVREERAKAAAWTAADDFSYQLYEQAAGTGLAEHREIMTRLAEQQKVKTVETDFFNSRNWPELLKNVTRAAREVYQITADQPVSEAVEAGDRFLVALFLDSRPAVIPAFDTHEEVQNLTIEWARREKSIALARQTAAATHQTIITEHGEEADSAALVADFEFRQSDYFSRNSPPVLDPYEYSWLMLEELDRLPEGIVAAPLESQRGALLMMLTERLEPDPEVLTENRQNARDQLLYHKTHWKMNAFIEEMEKRSQTQLIDSPLSYLWR